MTTLKTPEKTAKNECIEFIRETRELTEGEEIGLHHWLYPIQVSLDCRADYIHFRDDLMTVYYENDRALNFSLTTGQPATELDYLYYYNIAIRKSDY